MTVSQGRGRPRNTPSRGYLGKIGTRIRSLRDGQGMSVDKACKKAGIDRSTWYRIEAGDHDICLSRAKTIAKVLKVQVGDLVSV